VLKIAKRMNLLGVGGNSLAVPGC